MADGSPWPRVKSEIYSLFGRNPRSNRTIPAIAALQEEHRVLDIGCGPGAAVRAAAPLVTRAVGIDRSPAMIEIARRRSRHLDNVEYATGGAEALPLDAATFDRVWTIHSFHHWDDPEAGIAEALRVLRPAGRFLVVETETNGAHGLSRSGAERLAERFAAAGFATTEVTKHRRQLVVTGIVDARPHAAYDGDRDP